MSNNSKRSDTSSNTELVDHDSALAEDAPTIEHCAVDHVKSVTCPGCGREVETPREEPWLIHGATPHAPMLAAFVCPRCEHEIRVDER